ncbi:DUF397 domain-containing protein [Actinomadura nitritigenes]|uniref:DUF397 domain-containing protein n=1 Tax=Actinomadura nitritigenes TaxID=134602 RepID=UPI003D8C6A29
MAVSADRRSSSRSRTEITIRNGAGRVAWRKSSYSQPTQSDCVEVARLGAAKGVRDSKNPEGGFLSLEPDAWAALVSGIKRGAYDFDGVG